MATTGLNRLCENPTPAFGPEKPTSTDSIWRVLASGEGSDDPFFILQKQCFGVFTQSVKPGANERGAVGFAHSSERGISLRISPGIMRLQTGLGRLILNS